MQGPAHLNEQGPKMLNSLRRFGQLPLELNARMAHLNDQVLGPARELPHAHLNEQGSFRLGGLQMGIHTK